MGSRFRLGLLARLVALLAVGALLVWLAVTTRYYASMLVLGTLIVVQTLELAHYIDRTNRMLAQFVNAIRHADFTQSFNRPGPASFEELGATFDGVMRRLREERRARAEQSRYLQHLVEHVPVALIAIDGDSNLQLYNRAAQRLFGMPQLKRLDDLSTFGAAFPERLRKLEPGRAAIIKIRRDEESLQLRALASEIRLGKNRQRLVSLQDIGGDLEARELEAWQNLIRVLTHEIMNSITPISSLAGTARDTLREASTNRASTDELLTDVDEALEAVQRRTEGLTGFVGNYRRLLRVPEPRLTAVPLRDSLARVQKLMGEAAREAAVKLATRVHPSSLTVSADPDLLEQALINLIKNGIEACESRPDGAINVVARLAGRGRIIIEITDNGAGMSGEVLDNLFVPFFTTKRGGSGVGTSLVRQIMRRHDGQVSVDSRPGQGTTFTLSFPA